jgi:hypothetical protein
MGLYSMVLSEKLPTWTVAVLKIFIQQTDIDGVQVKFINFDSIEPAGPALMECKLRLTDGKQNTYLFPYQIMQMAVMSDLPKHLGFADQPSPPASPLVPTPPVPKLDLKGS